MPRFSTMIPKLALVSIFLLASCQATNPVPPNTVPVATNAPLLGAPILVAPADELEFEDNDVRLEWKWDRELLADQHYDLRVWPGDNPAHPSITWVQDTSFALDRWLLDQKQPGKFSWSVAVVQGRNGKFEKQISAESEVHHFTVQEVVDAATKVNVPPGFHTQQVGKFINPTALAFGPEGWLYVCTVGGEIYRLKPDGSGQSELFAKGFEIPLGMVFRDRQLYVSSRKKISILEDQDGDGQAESRRDIVKNLLAGYTVHQNNGIVFGPDGRLYIGQGGTSDHGPENNPLGGTIVSVQADGSDLQVYARGLRNPYGLAFDHAGRLFAGDSGPDTPDLNMLSIPPDELNLIVPNADYGYPTIFGMPPPGSPTQAPIALFPASSVPTGIAVYEGNRFPAEYRGNIFVALYGSTQIAFPTGHVLARVQLTPDGNSYRGTVSWFAQHLKRPIAVIAGSDEALYLADFESGSVFRIEYQGS